MLLGKSWVYRYIFKDIFPFLYGSETIQRNRLALTDEDASEYRTFETMTSRVPEYKRSKIMLCTFHAIWKYFKENIRPTLPKKGVMLSEMGRQYGTSLTQNFLPYILLFIWKCTIRCCVVCVDVMLLSPSVVRSCYCFPPPHDMQCMACIVAYDTVIMFQW